MNKFVAAAVLSIGLAALMFAGMKTEHVEAQVADEAAQTDERVFMLNILWFKEDGGAEKYAEYIAAASPFVAKHGGESTGAYIPEATLIGKFDADLFFVVEWPNQAAFLALVSDPEYLKISHLREEALRDSVLVRCVPAPQ